METPRKAQRLGVDGNRGLEGAGGDRAPAGVDRDSKKGNKQSPGALMIKSPGFVLKP